MKRLSLYAGLGASLALCMLVACSDKASNAKPAPRKANADAVDRSSTETPEPAEAVNPISAATTGADETSCSNDQDCALMPVGLDGSGQLDCYGCMRKKGSHRAVNKTTQEAFVKANMQRCMGEFQKVNPAPGAESAGACQLDGAWCNNGTCTLKKLSKAEKEAQQQERQRAMQEHQQRNGNGQGMGQGGNGQGQPQGQPMNGQGQPQGQPQG